VDLKLAVQEQLAATDERLGLPSGLLLEGVQTYSEKCCRDFGLISKAATCAEVNSTKVIEFLKWGNLDLRKLEATQSKLLQEPAQPPLNDKQKQDNTPFRGQRKEKFQTDNDFSVCT
jgi:hypothetical protein